MSQECSFAVAGIDRLAPGAGVGSNDLDALFAAVVAAASGVLAVLAPAAGREVGPTRTENSLAGPPWPRTLRHETRVGSGDAPGARVFVDYTFHNPRDGEGLELAIEIDRLAPATCRWSWNNWTGGAPVTMRFEGLPADRARAAVDAFARAFGSEAADLRGLPP